MTTISNGRYAREVQIDCSTVVKLATEQYVTLNCWQRKSHTAQKMLSQVCRLMYTAKWDFVGIPIINSITRQELQSVPLQNIQNAVCHQQCVTRRECKCRSWVTH